MSIQKLQIKYGENAVYINIGYTFFMDIPVQTKLKTHCM